MLRHPRASRIAAVNQVEEGVLTEDRRLWGTREDSARLWTTNPAVSAGQSQPWTAGDYPLAEDWDPRDRTPVRALARAGCTSH